MDARDNARRLAREHLERGDAVGWFERLYAMAEGDPAAIPWADLASNPALSAWLAHEPPGEGALALVVGCGLGDDAERLAAHGYTVVAFDVSATAVAWAQKRFPQSTVQYVCRDLLAPTPGWNATFALVFEAYTLQVLPPEARVQAVARIAAWVAPGGRACVVARARDEREPAGSMPWPLTRTEMGAFVAAGLREIELREFLDDEQPPVRRWQGVYEKPAPP
jgi:SAM-dependent methyltransferase